MNVDVLDMSRGPIADCLDGKVQLPLTALVAAMELADHPLVGDGEVDRYRIRRQPGPDQHRQDEIGVVLAGVGRRPEMLGQPLLPISDLQAECAGRGGPVRSGHDRGRC